MRGPRNSYGADMPDGVSSVTGQGNPDGAAPVPGRRRRKAWGQLWFWVLVAIAAGIVLGLVAPGVARETKWLADAFIQLIKTVTGPVIFVTMVLGIASLGNLARAGGLALRAPGYFLAATVVALVLGLLAGNLVAPGAAGAAPHQPAARTCQHRSRTTPGPARQRHRAAFSSA